ncbi:T9SS type A sorting domain-containing protein, partial [bacterium]|nr:T9SS type A sorting domain-containing protein [bacterium]
SYDTDENAYGVTIYGDYAYVADGDGGLCIIHIADPENPVLVDTYYAPDCVVDVFISGDYAYTAASESGLLVLDASNYVSVENIVNPPLPTEFSLSVYPNPFNSTTTITYSLPTATEVSLALYNLSGQRVTMIVESFMHPGIHSSILFAADLPSGLYFVKLTASDRVFTQKIILIR